MSSKLTVPSWFPLDEPKKMDGGLPLLTPTVELVNRERNGFSTTHQLRWCGGTWTSGGRARPDLYGSVPDGSPPNGIEVKA